MHWEHVPDVPIRAVQSEANEKTGMFKINQTNPFQNHLKVPAKMEV